MPTTSVEIIRTDDPSAVKVEFIDSHGRHLEMALSNLREGDGDDASILDLAREIVAQNGGSIDDVLDEAVGAAGLD